MSLAIMIVGDMLGPWGEVEGMKERKKQRIKERNHE